ncbi:acetyl-CoA carboxylase biotin carboxyl carrier protein [Blattabacterium cuenoti]|uniref:acetyl-CoA carboxylase biotin carboxyl carrier protein n=1 Tax=Blattabacterium cuenoti TaxID=1653831 RepID=UPI00163D2E53|nr:acetyl-CoA carboxylase biotin carboxyl carrier protein [Blattabacterium cuenoti]
MDINTIKSLIKLISKSNVAEIKIKMNDIKIYIKNNCCNNKVNNNYNDYLSYEKNSYSKCNMSEYFSSNDKKKKNDKYVTIKSPMIGIFYRKPHPNKDPFVKVGDIIKVGMKVCVIEAMKLFNDIEAEVNGKLVKILVEDATPVDYDQPLFILESYKK